MSNSEAQAAKDSNNKTVKLVSPHDSKDVREVEVGSPREVKLRYDGFLPEGQAKLKAREPVRGQAPKTVGTNA